MAVRETKGGAGERSPHADWWDSAGGLAAAVREFVASERQARWEAILADGKQPRLDASRAEPASELTPWENLLRPEAAAAPDAKALSEYLEKNELGDAELFQLLHGADFCFDHSREKWLTFSGVVWKEDKLGQSHKAVVMLAEMYVAVGKQIYRHFSDKKAAVDEKIMLLERQMVRLVEADASTEEMRKLRHDIEELKDESTTYAKKAANAKKKFDQRAKELRTKKRSLSVLSMSAIGLDSMGRTGTEFDQHPTLLAFANGVVDLETGRLLRSSPGLHLTKGSSVEYPGFHAYSRWWDDHLRKVFCDNDALIDYFESCIGYSATGLQVNKDIWVALGPQADNGKSVTFNAIKHVLGDVSTTVKLDVLLEEKFRNKGPDPDLMVLDGIRMGLASEASGNVKFSMERIKAITGGDDIRARAMYADSKIIQSSVKLWLHTNEIPQISGYDPGFMLRLRILPFLAKFVRTSEEVDLATHRYPGISKFELDQQLKAAYPAIAAWVVRCARKFMLNMNYQTPALVLQKTQEYFEEQDMLGEFIASRCTIGKSCHCGSAEIHKVFAEWCKDSQGLNDKQIWSNKRLSGELVKRGYQRVQTRPSTIFGGIQPVAV